MSNKYVMYIVFTSLLPFSGCGGATPDEAAEPEPEEVTAPVAPEPQPAADEPARPLLVSGEPEPRDRRGGGVMRVKELVVAPAVTFPDNEAINPVQSFRTRISKIMASFYASGLEEGGTITVRWHRGNSQIQVDDIESQGNKRYAVALRRAGGIASGDYSVEVELDGNSFARRTFHVGGNNVSPAVAGASLSGKGKKGRAKGGQPTFKTTGANIKCNAKLISMPDNAKVEVNWVSLGDDGEKTLHTSQTEVKKGGKSKVSFTWNPEGALTPGQYKASIIVNTHVVDELPFTVE